MKRNPYHFGAPSGHVLACVRLEFYERARGQRCSKTI
jgi:hypothetical protein